MKKATCLSAFLLALATMASAQAGPSLNIPASDQPYVYWPVIAVIVGALLSAMVILFKANRAVAYRNRSRRKSTQSAPVVNLKAGKVLEPVTN